VRLADLVATGASGEAQEALLRGLLDEYAETLAPHVRKLLADFRCVDVARKVVGVGSVGTRAWIMLLKGRDERDPLELQAKEAQGSVLEAHLGPAPHDHRGRRVVEGGRFMQAASDPLLGWERATGIDGVVRDFYVRPLWDGKWSAAIDTLPPQRMAVYAELCGWALARAHGRSGDRVAIAAYLGSGPSLR